MSQPNYAPPSGVWCSCPPSTGIGNGSVDPSVATKSYVNGILVRAVWKDVEFSDDNYNWSLIDDQITAAKFYNKKISLAIGGGPNSPNWLYGLGADSITFTSPFPGKIPVPWDTIFMDKWSEFIIELGNRYKNDTTIQLVYITNSSSNGFEMQIPFNPSPSYSSLGYNDQLMIDSWKKIIITYDSAFPNHYLTNDFHPVNSSDVVADSVYLFAKQIMPLKYGANAWWWTQHNTTVYPNQYNIIKNSANSNVFSGLQMAKSGVSDSASFGAGGMPTALNLAISDNICYWEIWNNDITDGRFDSILSIANCSASSLNQLSKNSLKIYPNPTTDFLNISLSDIHIQTIEIIDANGKNLLTKRNINKYSYSLNLESLEQGIYFILITDINHQFRVSKIIRSL